MTGRSPRTKARAVSGITRAQLTSPGPYTFASRVTAIGIPYVAAYERAIMSVAAFETSYG